jgi:glycosyltransferase involved in cell wall biosynthesis
MLAIWIALGLSSVYLFLEVYYLLQWNQLEEIQVPATFEGTSNVTIVIVAHNEAESIGPCIQDLLAQEYPQPLFKISIIDDHSTDQTKEEILKIPDDRVTYFSLRDFAEFIHPPAFKKSGIALAVHKSESSYIVVTDADCQHPKQWLRTILFQLEENKACFQTAPVLLSGGTTLIEKMQELEQLVLMLITGAGIRSGLHDMANGANMAFTKEAFLDVNGFDGNYQYASGDDMFLIERMRLRYPTQISFAKSISAAVFTFPKKNWSDLLQQRIRWSGKNKGLAHKTIQNIWIFVGLVHVFLILFLILAALQLISWSPFFLLLISKWVADFLLMARASSFFKRTEVLSYFLPLQILYSYYVFGLGIAMISGKKGDWRSNET